MSKTNQRKLLDIIISGDKKQTGRFGGTNGIKRSNLQQAVCQKIH